MRRHIPNMLTLSNLFCGCCAVALLLYGQPVTAAWFTLASFLFDYADGMVARALSATGPMGRELDSLADVVSFGVAPGAMLYGLLAGGYCGQLPATTLCVPALPAFVLSAFAAYRLARFNLDTTHRDYFVGLSTPGCTVFVLGLTLAAYDNQFGIGSFIAGQPWVIYAVVVVFSWLMVSEVPMFGLKVRSLRWRENKLTLVFFALAVVALLFLKGLGLALAVLFYLVFSVFSKNNILRAAEGNPHP
ncbi:MAG: CDP-alcohol phosphatidyltransferase family protein [Saprospiraceae bacterium]|jgi:CDP-diacylglycerol--serine O-phosphatidyltransferase|nr:CDP-alcohol phosphatidyltransferase family protein [Saprospiraceae bacterium]